MKTRRLNGNELGTKMTLSGLKFKIAKFTNLSKIPHFKKLSIFLIRSESISKHSFSWKHREVGKFPVGKSNVKVEKSSITWKILTKFEEFEF